MKMFAMYRTKSIYKLILQLLLILLVLFAIMPTFRFDLRRYLEFLLFDFQDQRIFFRRMIFDWRDLRN
jgi:hypothetical protein